MKLPRLAIADPGLSSLKSAARAAIVMPAVFALASQVIQQPQTALFAAFGSFAMLVLVDFSGSPRSRFTAYLSLALIGAVFVVVGTLCSRNAWLAAAAMAVVGFAILFSGVINGYFAAGGTAAILAFVLPVAVPAPLSEVPWRLAGWGLAAGTGICAVMLIWPERSRSTLRGDAARACVALADLAGSALSGDAAAIETRTTQARAAVDELRKRFAAAPHRPTGPTGQAAALAALVDELGWVLVSLLAVAGSARPELCREENSEAMAAAATVLRASGGQLAGRDEPPDTARLEQAQEAVVRALAERISRLPPTPDDETIEALLGRSFRTRAISYTTRQIAGYALVASGAADPGGAAGPGRREPARLGPGSLPAPAARRIGLVAGALQAVRRFATEHASARSVWFRNSIRGAAGLAVAVFIAQRSGLQHSFWVVLGTLSVLRSNALGTGKTIVSALAGTAAGIAAGAAILIPLGSSSTVLWVIFPVAVLVAAYAPRVISFAAGQAAFTVVILILFNILQPVGWKVGLIRIEDVAIGFAVSLGVGLVFWPRGAASVLREDLANAYSRGADFVATVAHRLAGIDQAGDPADPARAGQVADTAVHRLDDAFRQYLAERSAKRVDPESAARLVAGAGRLLRTGRSMASLDGMMAGNGSPGRCGASLESQVQALRSWYVTLGDSVARGTQIPPPQPPDPAGQRWLLHCIRDAIAGGETGALHEAVLVLWASQHLDILRRQESHLGEQAAVASSLLPGG